MSSEKTPLTLALKKYASWLEAHLGLIIGSIIWAALILIVLLVGNIQPGDRIQAASMITLVLITFFYAIQTQALVKEERRALEEERKRRNSEFGMRRVKEFLLPLVDNLDSLRDSVYRVAEAPKNPLGINIVDAIYIFNAQLNGIKKLFNDYLYMTDPIIRYGYLKIVKMHMPNPQVPPPEELIVQWRDGIYSNIDELKAAVNDEITRICQTIRKTYSFDLQTEKNRGSLDDLVVLSTKPPARI